METDKTSNRWICDICQLSFTAKSSIVKHIKRIHLNEIIKSYPDSTSCDFCKKFVLKENFKAHVRQKHKLRRCKTCERAYFNLDSYNKHLKEHNNQVYSCDLCKYKNPHKTGVKTHILNVHLRQGPRSKCEHCGKMVTLYGLQKHIDGSHKKLRAFKCAVCKKGFSTPPSLRRHLATVHLNEKSFVCPICDYTFTQKCSLTRHTNVIHGIKPQFKCGKCGRTYNTVRGYEKHLRGHEEEKSC